MQSNAFNESEKPPNNETTQVTCTAPNPKRSLKRMEGTSHLKPIVAAPPFEKLPKSTATSSLLTQSASMMNLQKALNPPSKAHMPLIGFRTNGDRESFLFNKPKLDSGLTRTLTSTVSLKNSTSNEKKLPVQLRIHQDDRKVPPIRMRVERTPGGTITKAAIIPKLAPVKEFEKPSDQDQVTPPPSIRRTSSGSMLLRQTPERVRRQEEEETTQTKRMRRSGSMPKSLCVDDRPDPEPTKNNCMTPVLKRKRTSSLTSLRFSDMPVLTPYSPRLRGNSESRMDEYNQSPVKKIIASPVKKRIRQDSESLQTSPLKKRYISTVLIKLGGDEDDASTSTPILTTSMRRAKSTIFNPKAVTERIAQTYGIDRNRPAITEQPTPSIDLHPPKLVTRSTSGDTYYTATEGDESILLAPSNERAELYLISENSQQSNNDEMVPLVKKQISVDEKILEDDEDEGFGDSMKTIKRGQGSALARSLSLKLSPRNDLQKPIGADTEKSCSTPSLPTAPLIRQSSTSSLRFKVSPSSFLKPLINNPVNIPSPSVDQAPKLELSEPSTSKVLEVKAAMPALKKSALKKQFTAFNVKDDHPVHGSRRRKIKFSGLNVHYFDRRQGESTVPTEGDVSLDMHNTHHSHRYFSLASGKRPPLDLSLYEDDELSDGEVIDPDSDEEREYDEYASAKTIPRINQKHRIKLLKKSGVRVEKNAAAVDSLRSMRGVCGCSCENGVCLPETCQCAIDGIQCQVDGADYPTLPCACFAETCTNPEGRIFYDQDAVREFRVRTIMNWRAAQKVGVSGSPIIKKFVDSDDEEDINKSKTWLLKKAIPLQHEESPTKYPVTPVYTRRSRSSLSDIRESSSEASSSLTPSTSLSERMKAMQHLDNDVCVEVEEDVVDKEETIIEADITLQEVYVARETDAMKAEAEILETAMSPVKTTLVV